MSGTIAALAVAGAIAGCAAAMVWPQTYVASTEVMVSDMAADPLAVVSEAELAVFETRLRLLRSGTVLNAAVDRLNLAADPEFNGSADLAFGIGRQPQAVRIADEAELRRRRAVAALQDAIDVQRSGQPGLATVTARSSDPEKSALLANAVSEAFVAEAGGVAAGAASLDDLKAGLDAAERVLAEFRQATGVDVTAAELARLEQQLAAARERTAALGIETDGQIDAGLDQMATGSVVASASPILEEARTRLAAATQRVESLSERLGPRHPELIAAQAELDAVQREVESESGRLAARLEAERDVAARTEMEIAARLDRFRKDATAAGENLARLRALEQAADMRRAALEDAMQMASSSGQSAQDAWIVSRAARPDETAGPSVPILSLAGAFGGLLAGFGFAGWRRTAGSETSSDDPAVDDAEQLATPNRYHHACPDPAQDGPGEAETAAKEAPVMYPYQPHAHPAAPRHQHEQGDQPQPVPAYHAGPVAHAHPAAVQGYHPAQMQDGWAMAGYPAPAAPMMGYPQQHMPAVVYVPVPAHQVMQHLQQMPSREGWQRPNPADRRTEAAIEEIRQSLRDLREAIEDFADQRYG